MAKKKINPKRKPATQADIIKAKKDAQNKAIDYAWAIFFTVMVDKEGYGRKGLTGYGTKCLIYVIPLQKDM